MSAFDKWVKRSGGGPAAAANRETQMNRQPQRVQRFQVPNGRRENPSTVGSPEPEVARQQQRIFLPPVM